MVVQKFLDRRYEEEVLNEHFNKVDRIEWKELFIKKKETSHRIPLLITYNETLLNISRIVNRHRNILQVNTGFRGVFQVKPVIAFKRIENTPEIIGSHTIKQTKVFKKSLDGQTRKSLSCSLARASLCSLQIVNTKTFTSHQTKRMVNVFHKLTYRSQCAINLMEYIYPIH